MYVLSFQLIATSESKKIVPAACIQISTEIPISTEMLKTEKISTKQLNLEPVEPIQVQLNNINEYNNVNAVI